MTLSGIDGTTGKVYVGAIDLVEPTMTADFERVMKLSDKFRRLRVRTNADTPHDAQIARDFGAEGIGLTSYRTYVLLIKNVYSICAKMILSNTLEARVEALNAILPFQEQDFYEIYLAMLGMNNCPSIRPTFYTNSYQPKRKKIVELAKALHMSVEAVKERISFLHEFNPNDGPPWLPPCCFLSRNCCHASNCNY